MTIKDFVTIVCRKIDSCSRGFKYLKKQEVQPYIYKKSYNIVTNHLRKMNETKDR
jgi:hypothetical protein